MDSFAYSALLLIGAAFTLFTLVRSMRGRVMESAAGGLTFTALVLVPVAYELGSFGEGLVARTLVVAISLTLLIGKLTVTPKLWRGKVPSAFFGPAAVSLAFALVNAILVPHAEVTSWIVRFVPVVYWFVLAVVVAVSGVTVEHMVFAVATMLVVVSILSAVNADSWRACDQFKCGIMGEIFTGPFPSENFLGRLAGYAIIIGLFGARSQLRLTMVGLGVLLMVGATSRTAAIALIGAVILGGLLGRSAKGAGRLARVVLVAILSMSSLWLVVNSTADSFSNRGGIWIRTLQVIEGHLLFGLGIDRWRQLQAIGMLPVNYPHNQLLLLLFGGGIAATTLYLWFQLKLVSGVTADGRRGMVAFGLLAYGLCGGIAEVMWNPGAVDGNVLSVLLVLGAYACPRRNSALEIGTRPTEVVRSGRRVSRAQLRPSPAGLHSRVYALVIRWRGSLTTTALSGARPLQTMAGTHFRRQVSNGASSATGCQTVNA